MTPVTITLGLLVWNNATVGLDSLTALIREAQGLTTAGFPAEVIVLDNGSYDDFHAQASSSTARVYRLSGNIGISRGRNFLVDTALSNRSSYVLLMDGDIEVVPGSVLEMVRFLESHPAWAGLCPSPLSSTWTRDEVTPHASPITEQDLSCDALMYVCGYGLFRTPLFSMVRFETGGPFGLPGWGHEDNDFYCQLVDRQQRVDYVTGLVYLHRHPHSSWVQLQNIGVDIESAFNARRAYLLRKWRTQSAVSGILQLMRAQQFQGSVHV